MTSTAGIQAALEGLIAEFGNDWRSPTSVVVADFGFDEVAPFTDRHRRAFVNLPGHFTRQQEHQYLGVCATRGSDGVAELIVLGEDGFELCFADDTGVLLPTTDERVRDRLLHTVTAARRSAIRGDTGSFLWADARIRAIGAGGGRNRHSAAPMLVGDQRAAATAGVSQQTWDEFAAVMGAHWRAIDPQSLIAALLKSAEEGVSLSPEALLVLTVNRWNVRTTDTFMTERWLSEAEFAGAASDLRDAGLLEWPASLPLVLEQETMDVLRSMFGPRGIRAQSKAKLLERAFETLSESQIAGLAEGEGVDLNRPMFTEESSSYVHDWSSADPRVARLVQLAERSAERILPAGVPEPSDDDLDSSFSFSLSINDDDIDAEHHSSELGSDVQAFSSASQEVVEIATALLGDPDTRQVVGMKAAALIADLADVVAAALREES